MTETVKVIREKELKYDRIQESHFLRSFLFHALRLVMVSSKYVRLRDFNRRGAVERGREEQEG